MQRHIAHNPRYVKLARTSGITKLALATLLGFGGAAFAGIAPAPAVHAESPTSVTGLKVGANGEPVAQLQQALIDAGFAVPGGADGVFGAGTEAALKQFQSAQGLNASGTVTTATALALGLMSSPYLGLAAGATGDAVRQLQQRLVDRGIAVAGGADGVFGPGTTAAVKELQRQLGYYPSGTVNAATAAALGQTSSGNTGGSSGGGGLTPAQPATADEPGDRGTAAPAAAPGGGALVGLALGQRGDGVKQLQQLLSGAGVEVVGGADGIFGVLTQAALKSFQSAKGLNASGVVDQATVDALNSAQGGQSGETPQGLTNNNGGAGSLVGLSFGATGDGVKKVQTALLQAGYTVRGGADGVFGNSTQSALKAFQTSNAIEATGKVDERTAQALLTVLGDTPDPGTANGALIGLQPGSTGGDVKALQEILIGLGIEVRGGADGIFGPATAQAVKNFQTSQGIAASGKVDAATAAALANPQPIDNPPDGGADGYPEYGERGERVLALQAALVKAGIVLVGGVDGDFGASTTKAVREFQEREGLPVTGKVDAATAAKLGLGAAPAPIVTPPSAVTLEHFPVAKPCGFADTWHFDRGGGRQHLGVDIIAPTGTEVYAAVTGKVSKVYVDAPGSLSGNGVRIALPDGTYFFYAHLTALAPGIELGVPVTAGQVIGTVGSTGNSATPHLHFEIHPQGGSAINPYPVVKAINGC